MLSLNDIYKPVTNNIDSIELGRRDSDGSHAAQFQQAYYRVRLPNYLAKTQFIANKILTDGMKRSQPKMWFTDFQERILSDRRLIDIVKGILKLKLEKSEIQVEHNVLDGYFRFYVMLNSKDELQKRSLSKEELQSDLNNQLLLAVSEEKIEDVKNCVKNGADINMRDPLGRTPLYAIVKNHQLVHVLVELKANVNVVDLDGLSPLDVAKFFDPEGPFVNALLSHGALSGKEINASKEEELKTRSATVKQDFEEKEESDYKEVLSNLGILRSKGYDAVIFKRDKQDKEQQEKWQNHTAKAIEIVGKSNQRTIESIMDKGYDIMIGDFEVKGFYSPSRDD